MECRKILMKEGIIGYMNGVRTYHRFLLALEQFSSHSGERFHSRTKKSFLRLGGGGGLNV